MTTEGNINCVYIQKEQEASTVSNHARDSHDYGFRVVGAILKLISAVPSRNFIRININERYIMFTVLFTNYYFELLLKFQLYLFRSPI